MAMKVVIEAISTTAAKKKIKESDEYKDIYDPETCAKLEKVKTEKGKAQAYTFAFFEKKGRLRKTA